MKFSPTIRRDDLPAIPVLIVALGLTLMNQEFAKTKVGPIYATEWCFIAWCLTAWLAGWHRRFRLDALLGETGLSAACAFLAWGLALFGRDILFRRAEIASMERVLQHCQLFVDPALWAAVGFATFWRSPRATKWVAVAVLVGTLARTAGLGANYANVAIGPLGAVALMYFLSRQDKASPLLGLASGFAGIVPYVIGVSLGHVPRLNLVELLFAVIAAGFLFHRGHPRRALLSVVAVLGLGTVVLAGAIRAAVPQPEIALRDAATRQLYGAFHHGDDYDEAGQRVEGGSHLLQAGYRRFWWGQTLRDWAASPGAGRGFIPEIPAFVSQGQPNDGLWGNLFDFKVHHVARPLSGPHNSYLTVLARTGVIGALIFGVFVASLIAATWRLTRSRAQVSLFEALGAFLVFFGLCNACLHIGFEAPFNCVILWFFGGVMLAQTRSSSR